MRWRPLQARACLQLHGQTAPLPARANVLPALQLFDEKVKASQCAFEVQDASLLRGKPVPTTAIPPQAL